MKHLRELSKYSHLIWSFARRDIRARYKQTALGVAWAILQPFSLMVVFTLVFSKLAQVPSDGVPYPIFVYSSLIFWTYFATTVSQGTVAMTANGNLVRKIYFPRETLLIAVLLAAGLDFLIAFSILVILFVYFQHALSWTAFWVVPLLFAQLVFTWAVICLTSTIHVYFRDIGHALQLGLQLWLYATPVAYPLSMVSQRLKPLYFLNPMASIIDGYRKALLHDSVPDLQVIGTWLLIILLLAWLTYINFKRAEMTFADVI
jgi:ABC-type polysaccharide/polyol phosphate export permease